MKCPNCSQEITGIVCPDCQEQNPEAARYCMMCGAPLLRGAGDDAEAEEFDLDDRILCPDGTCTGIIVDGKCTECGKAYNPLAEPGAESVPVDAR
jgi:hypothetical protein